MDNRAGEMEVFVQAAELRSFSAAGRKLGLSPSAVSKLVTRIEARLGTPLLVRSTRTLQLTPAGEIYLARAQRILGEIDDTERAVAGEGRAAPRGRLKVSSLVGFGERYLYPLVPEFLQLHPQVELDLSLSDDLIDLIDERADIAVRSGELGDTALKARKLLESPRVVVASPDYLARRGAPQTPDDLARHNCLRFNFRSRHEWLFRDPAGGAPFARSVSGDLLANSGGAVRRLCLEGQGLARLGRFHVQPDIDAGALVPVLEAWDSGEVETVRAVYVGHPHLAARIRAFIDFLAERIAAEAR